MKAFWTLLKLSFKSLMLTTFSAGSGSRKKHAARTGVGAFVLMAVLMLYLSSTFSFMLASAFSALGGLDVMLMLMMLMACVWPFVFTVFASQALVFGTKDVDLVMSLPVSSFSVMLSRVLALYLEALLMCEMMLIPAGVAYVIHGGAGGPAVVAYMLVQGVFLALIPTLLALVFGSLISLLVAKLPFKNLFITLFSILLTVGIMVFTFSFSFSMGNLEQAGAMALDIDGLRGTIAGAFPPVAWAVRALGGQAVYMLPLALVCVAPFLAVTWLFSRVYKRLLTLLSSHRLKSNYRLGRVKATGSMATLLKKEAKKFFGTPSLFLNSGIGIILLLLASVVAVFNKSAITDFIAELTGMGAGDVTVYLAPLLLAVLLFFGSLTYTSAVSISLEGKTLWILKEAPLGVGRIFTAKAGFNFILCAVCTLVCVPLVAVAFSLSAADVAAMLAVGLLCPLFLSMAGLFINLLLPKMDAENDTVVIKQSASAMVAMLLGMVLLALLVVGFVLANMRGMGFGLYAAIASAALAALCALAAVLLNTKGRRLFAQL